jgi:hypothetical protein
MMTVRWYLNKALVKAKRITSAAVRPLSWKNQTGRTAVSIAIDMILK